MVHCVSIISAVSAMVPNCATDRTSNLSTIVPSGALQQGAPQSLKAQQICTSIEVYQPWRIEECRGTNKRVAAQVRRTGASIPAHWGRRSLNPVSKRNIKWILSRSPAFAHDGYGRWRMTGRPLVRTAPSNDSMRTMTKVETKAYL